MQTDQRKLKPLAEGRWQDLSLCQQMANIGSEIGRAIKWKNQANQKLYEKFLFKGIEYLDLTIQDKKYLSTAKLREICRLKEFLCDHFLGDDSWGFDDEWFEKYLNQFALSLQLKDALKNKSFTFRLTPDQG
jgi:hypothetical protein